MYNVASDPVEIIDTNTETITTSEESVSQDTEKTDTGSVASGNLKQIANLMVEAKKMVDFLQSTMNDLKAEFGTTDDELAKLIEYNTSTRTPRVNDQSGDEYDRFNGIDLIPMERVAEIFGRESKIFGVEPSQTVDRLKYVAAVFTELFNARQEYIEIETAFHELAESQEQESLKFLQHAAETEVDPEKRVKAQEAIDQYNENKYLGFISKISGENQTYLVKTFSDQAKIRYLIERARIQMQRLKVPETFILEISGFEKRFLPEKYHHQNNMLLLMFLHLIVYSKPIDDKAAYRKVSSMVIGLDNTIRHLWSDDVMETVMTNIMAFEDLFADKISGQIIKFPTDIVPEDEASATVNPENT